MPRQVVGKIPEFTPDETEEGEQALKQINQEQQEAGLSPAEIEEKETPAVPPAETPPEELQKPSTEGGEDTGKEQELQTVIQGLQDEKSKLIAQLAELRGQRREIKQEQIVRLEQQIDELQDINPEDVSLIERVLKSKGYVQKADVEKSFYQRIQQQEINRFLKDFPEYGITSAQGDLNWSTLQQHLAEWYRLPDDPSKIYDLLKKAHQEIKPQVASDRDIPAKKRQTEIASVGAGGIQRSSSSRISLDPDKKAMMRAGGFTEEDIKIAEERLAE